MDDTNNMRRKIAHAMTVLTDALGAFPAFLAAAAIVATWATGLFFVKDGFQNDSYQLIINTTTTIITFLMVFIIQNTTNRESRAEQTKLDAILTNQRTILNAIAHLADDEDNPEICALVDEMMGLEDETSQEIKATQQRVREA